MAKRAKASRARGRKTLIQSSREKSSEEKAMYHQVLGAGSSKVIREFLSITNEDVRGINRLIATHIEGQLKIK